MFYYKVDLRDIINGKMHPLLAVSLIERLPQSSAFGALTQDKDNWREYLDLAPEYYALAGIYDAVNANTRATGNFKTPPKFKPWPLPHEVINQKKATGSVAGLFARLQARQ